jgi:hypothetical protein
MTRNQDRILQSRILKLPNTADFMRLINVDSYRVEEFPSNGAPPYAILSHTWGNEEVTLKDLEAGEWKHRQDKREGYEKITGCCAAAAAEGFGYAWIDTCCIDKTSSAELSEAINSMFRWYHESAICYAYLRDVDCAQDPDSEDSDFSKSRWFTRGWTLQELLAPTEIVFLGRDWGEIGTKNTLQKSITMITRISSAALEDRSFGNYSVAQKMSWAAGRCTTRPEDEAYCLLGLFDVNMPLLYGEGQGAFFRLQEEIMKRTDDESIFAWSHPTDEQSHVHLTGLLASSPNLFRDSSDVTMAVGNAKKAVSRGLDSSESYLNAFELVRQLVRVRLPILGPLKGMELNTRGPVHDLCSFSHAVPETETSPHAGHLKTSGPGVKVTPSISTPGSEPPTILSPSIDWALGDDEVRISQINEAPRPQICLDSLDGGDSIELVAKIEEEEGNEGPLGEDATSELSNQTEAVERDGPCPKWRWYIYEPVVLVPLMCTIDGKPLALLLSRGPFRSREEGVLYRLHSPSLVCIEDFSHFTAMLSPLRTTYVYASTRYNNEIESSKPVTSEVRIGQVLETGYALLEEQGSDWTFDQKEKKLVKIRDRHQSRSHMIVFQHRTQETHNYPSFFMLISFNEPRIGILHGSSIPVLGSNVWRAQMGKQSRAEFSMGIIGRSVVLKERKLARVKYLSVSIEQRASTVRGAAITPVLRGLGALNMRLQRIWSTLEERNEHSSLDAAGRDVQGRGDRDVLSAHTVNDTPVAPETQDLG